MYVSDPPGLIFVHIPRTGGSSIKEALRNSKVLPQRRLRNAYLHGGVRYLRWLLGEDFEMSYRFSFVRNPWERLVSRYCMLSARWGLLDGGLIDPPKGKTFREWLLGRSIGCVSPLDLRSQSEMLTTPDGELDVHFVGRFECYKSDIHRLRSHLGIDLRVARRNRVCHDAYREYYDREARAFVADRFGEDVARWGYTF